MGTRRHGQGVLAAWAAVFALLAAAAPLRAGEEPAATPPAPLEGKLPPLKRDASDPGLLGEEPPAGLRMVPWEDWAENQRIRPLRRWALDFTLGGAIPNGPSAYESAFGSSAIAGLEFGHGFAPFLTVSIGAFAGELGGSTASFDAGGTATVLRMDSMNFSLFDLTARLRFPLALLGPDLFRFRRARESTGFVPYLELGLGLARLGSVSADREYEASPGLWQYDTVLVLDNALNFSYRIGFGLQIRWSWGGMALEISRHDLGKPTVVFGKNHFEGGSLGIVEISLQMGFYF